MFQLTEETRGTAGTERALTPLELAARLASFIWNSVPDATLLDHADAGTLSDPQVLDTQVKRLLTDAKAKRTAALIGVAHSGQGLVRTDVSGLPDRVGILTHPGSLAGMGDQAIGSFVNRGKYLMERLFCQNPVAVPAALPGG